MLSSGDFCPYKYVKYQGVKHILHLCDGQICAWLWRRKRPESAEWPAIGLNNNELWSPGLRANPDICILYHGRLWFTQIWAHYTIHFNNKF